MAIRCITNSKYNAHTAPLFKKLKILPFEPLVQYFHLLFMHDHKHKNIPRSFNNVWRTIEDINVGYPIRNSHNYRINYSRIGLTERLPICNLPKVWNSYNSNQNKNLISKEAFKFNVKNEKHSI